MSAILPLMGFFQWLNIWARIALLESQQLKLQGDLKAMATTIEQFQAVLARIDDATNKIAAELQDLKTQIAGGGLSADVETTVLASLDAAATKLEGIGKA